MELTFFTDEEKKVKTDFDACVNSFKIDIFIDHEGGAIISYSNTANDIFVNRFFLRHNTATNVYSFEKENFWDSIREIDAVVPEDIMLNFVKWECNLEMSMF